MVGVNSLACTLSYEGFVTNVLVARVRGCGSL